MYRQTSQPHTNTVSPPCSSRRRYPHPHPRSTQWSIQYHYGANRAGRLLQPQLAALSAAHPNNGRESPTSGRPTTQTARKQRGDKPKERENNAETTAENNTNAGRLRDLRNVHLYPHNVGRLRDLRNCPPLPTQRDRYNEHVAKKHTKGPRSTPRWAGQAHKLVVGQPI